MRLKDRSILVTGAASGIGTAIARLFCNEGATLALFDINSSGLKKVAAKLDRAHTFECDVADREHVDSAVTQVVGKLGKLDGIVNVAGIDLFREFGETTVNDWERVLAVNLTGPMHVCQACMPALLNCEASTIVNIASGAGLRPLVNRTAYCSSKAGLIMFSRALALEFAQTGLRVNVVCPGVIDTPLLEEWYHKTGDPDGARREAANRQAMGRIGKAEDIAYAALHLTSHESRYTTGSTLVVDGGRAFH